MSNFSHKAYPNLSLTKGSTIFTLGAGMKNKKWVGPFGIYVFIEEIMEIRLLSLCCLAEQLVTEVK